jgi:hypothetical protein
MQQGEEQEPQRLTTLTLRDAEERQEAPLLAPALLLSTESELRRLPAVAEAVSEAECDIAMRSAAAAVDRRLLAG